MSSFQGSISSAYESISPYRLYLDLSMDDTEFMSNKKPIVYFNELKPIPEHSVIKPFRVRPEYSTFSILSRMNETKDFIHFINYFRLNHLFSGDLHNEFTIFVPINESMVYIQEAMRTSYYEPIDIAKYHVLPYTLLPEQIQGDNILKLKTLVPNEYIHIRNKEIAIDNQIIKILKTIQSDNGFVYIIDKPLIPYYY